MAGRDDDVVVLDLERDIIDGAVRKVYQMFRVGLAVVVESFARGPSRVDATLGARFLATNLTAQDDPPVPDMPIIMPGGGGYGMHFDMAQGDLGVAIACDGPVRGLFETGDVVTPQRAVGHDYGCAVFIPGGRVSSSIAGQTTDPPNAAGTATIGSNDSSARVEFRRAGGPSVAEQGTVVVRSAGPVASVLLGGDTAVVPVACATQAQANLVALNTMIQALPVVPGDPGVIAALKTGFGTWAAALQDMADAKARVEGPGV